ncbi:Nn.00g052180.m01.CDS01 [Neocucurbitaria sp. VM-36]
MANTDMHLSEGLLRDKLASIEVNVAEIEPESPQVEFDRLTMQSPMIHPTPTTIIRCPPHDSGHLRPSSPTGSVRSSFSSSRRRVSRHSHFSSGFSRSHRSEVSKELSLQAESEFLALMELMSGISRRSSSLKEVWMKIISERESYASEMDRMYEQFEEYTETIERHQRDQHSHTHELEESKKEVTKLRLELSVSVSSSAEFKRKLADRDCELGEARTEIAERKDVYKYLKEEHEETKKTLEETQLKLVASEDACHHAREDSKRHHHDLESLDLKYVELQSTHTELTSKFESTHKEVISLKQSNSVYKKEKHEWLHEKGELEDTVRKCNHRCDELKRKVKELTESFEKKKHELTETIEKKKHELHETKETLSKVKYEKEELYQKVKELRRELEEEHCRWEDAEDRCGKWKLKWEHCDREITSLQEELRVIEIEQTELRETITKKTEEHRRLVIEKKRLEKDYHGKCTESEDRHREILVLQESLRRSETTIKEKTELIHTLHERIERLTRDRDDARTKSSDLEISLSTLQTTLVSLTLDLETTISERESLREKYHECQTRYEEVCESVTEYHEGNSSFEFEISSLRAMLREVREEREKAIQMRIAADRERDEAVGRFEAKCREMDKLEESCAVRVRERVLGGSRTVSKRFYHGSSSGVGEGDDAGSVVCGGVVDSSC